MRQFINGVIARLGRQNYRVDPLLSDYELTIVVFSRLFQLLRGFLLKVRLGSSAGLVFKGSGVTVLHPHKMRVGRTLILHNNVWINALCRSGIRIGNNVTLREGTIIDCTGVINELGEGLVIGDDVGFSHGCFIQVRGPVHIGSKVLFGPGVYVFSENHRADRTDIPISEQGTIRKGIIIEDGAWVGARSLILDGVRVGRNSIIAAGSVVTKDIPECEIWGGIPAKFIRSRKQ